MRRIATVLVAILVVTAGCSALSDDGADAAGADTPTPGQWGTAVPCSTDLLLTDAGTEAVTPKPLPGAPDEFTAEAVGAFAQRYELAFAHNHELGERVRDVTVTLQGTTVETVDGGYRVRVHVWTRTAVGTPGGATSDGTTDAVTTRESYYDAHYFVSESTLRRAETERHGTLPDPDLSESGVTLACWGE